MDNVIAITFRPDGPASGGSSPGDLIVTTDDTSVIYRAVAHLDQDRGGVIYTVLRWDWDQ